VSLAVRVIPCLDVDRGRVVKGVNFEDLIDQGDPVELAHRYGEQGADEVTFLDVTATVDDRRTTLDVVQHTAETLFIPLTVGGGVRSASDVGLLLEHGADKISVNSAALANPGLLDDIAAHFGSQVLVISLDVKRHPDQPSGFVVTSHGGRTTTNRDALDWAKEAVNRGAGEVLLNSIDADGTKDGFDVEMISRVRKDVSVPLVASGGAGSPDDFPDAVQAGADAVLAASIFHTGQYTIGQVKEALALSGAEVR
jgi:cyclase